MDQPLIWDLPTRLFHWLFAAGFVAAAVIALALGEHGPLFPYHAIIGLVLAGMVLLRLVWGVVGSRYARITSLPFRPADLAAYLKSVLLGRASGHVGHNPATAWAMLAMLAIMAGLGVTGVMLGRGNEGVKEVHEVLAYAMLGVAGMHVAGVVLHTVRQRENLTLGMIHGRKRAAAPDAIPSARPVAGLLFLVLAGAWGGVLLSNYTPATQTVRVPAWGTLQLGEAEQGRGEHRTRPGRHDDDD